MRDALLDAEIPVHSFFHEESLEDDQAKRAFTLFTLLAHPKDRVALRYWLGMGSPSWNAGAYGELRRYCEQTGQTPLEVLQLLKAGTLKISHTGKLVQRFNELGEELHGLAPLALPDLVDRLLPDGEAWASDLRFFASQGGYDGLDHAKLLERMRERVTQPEIPEDGEYVRIMSLHKSKGLTSKVVIVVGCLEGLIPKAPSGDTPQQRLADAQEQRRLFYVALTRCTEVLLLSSVAKLDKSLAFKMGVEVMGVFGEYATPIASTFFSELGAAVPRSRRGDEFLRSLS